MAKKYYLDSVSGVDSTTRFTLVFENPKNFFVEELQERHLPEVEKIVRNIPPSDFGRHRVNGVSLVKLIAMKLGETQL